ncbi:MAG: autotransporter domain-containing protein, partial [Clostridia bacterium]|nr:autotransporter domain-containing protein [Clostridia bacterium]
DSTFTKNTAGQYGGAIYNASALTLAGTNTFTGNTAGGVANDIHNTGTLNIQGNVSFEGGVTGTGTINVAEGTNIELGLATIEADAIAFAKDTTLGVTLTSDEMGSLKANTIAVGETEADQANLIVTLSKDFVTADKVTKQLTNGTAVDNGSFALANVDNALYNVSFDTATNEVTALRKTQEEQNAMVESAGGNTNDVAVINAFTSSADFGSEAANKTADLINQLVQTDVKAAVEATTALAPDAAASQQAVQSSSNQQLFSAITNRMNNMGGASPRSYALNDGYFYADEASYSVWAQGLLNKSHKENTPDSSAFNGRSTGLAAGADTKINDEWSAGLGYAYLHTNVSSFNRHNRILGDNFFLYGQYRPNNFFVQAALNYGDSKYEEDKYVAGNTVDADYHIKTYSANVTTGYEITENITPLFGLRYMNLQQEGYKDSSDQYISANKEDYLTAVLGVELQQESLLDDIKIIPAVNIGLAYDLLSSNASGHVTLPNGSSYDVTGGRLHRLSLEAGVSITAVVSDNMEVFLSYDGSFREDYNSNTGALKLRYLF